MSEEHWKIFFEKAASGEVALLGRKVVVNKTTAAGFYSNGGPELVRSSPVYDVGGIGKLKVTGVRIARTFLIVGFIEKSKGF
mmetsp:Transcript_63036/g.112005  ORF Transcript_63036/g.112005 Transcript_63036/m.112005 type:complete len:82 (+) Transcript_63036:1483-1728(+)